MWHGLFSSLAAESNVFKFYVRYISSIKTYYHFSFYKISKRIVHNYTITLSRTCSFNQPHSFNCSKGNREYLGAKSYKNRKREQELPSFLHALPCYKLISLSSCRIISSKLCYIWTITNHDICQESYHVTFTFL